MGLLLQLVHVPALKTLDLGSNEMTDSGARAVAAALKHVPKLTSLSIAHNSVTEAGVHVLALALGHVPELTSIHLGGNPVRSDALYGDIMAVIMANGDARNRAYTALHSKLQHCHGSI